MKKWLINFCRGNLWGALLVAKIRGRTLGIVAWCIRFIQFPAVHLASDVKLIGVRKIRIGKNTVVAKGCWFNVNNPKVSPVGLEIGKNCFFGQDNYIGIGKAVIIKDYCLTAKGCAFVCSAHIYDNPLYPYISTGNSEVDEIYIGPNCFFGISSKVLGNVRIGHGCVIGASAVIRDDVPPFSLVVGDPAKVIKRFDFSSKQWVRWPADDYAEGPDEDVYLAHLRQNTGWIIQPISAAFGGLHDTP